MMSAPAPYPTVQSSAPAPDDHQITSRTPSICVDYLSHNWTDEDVWSSWKAMTKRKNEIANGVRLENASWRTWAKQRGKLKTISPETLNWLKDSDVTWLYGPLHEHAEPVPPPKIASTQDRLDLDDSIRKKSILKHRTISEMLTTPGRSASPIVEYVSSADASQENSDTEGERGSRPSFFSVKSDSNLAQRKRKAGGSPTASERLFQNLMTGDPADALSHPPLEERKHISFNQRVDQCIAVDIDEEEEEEEGQEDEENDNSSDDLYDGDKHDGEEDDEDTPSSDEEVLTMRSSPRSSPAWPLTTHPSSQGSSPNLEHQTIAKLAPTMLKTSDTYPAPSPQVVDPTGFNERYSGNSNEEGNQLTLSSQPQVYQYGAQQDEEGLSQTRYSQWDADDDFNGDFDYFNGPDMSDNYEQANSLPAGVPKDEIASKVSKSGSSTLEPSSPRPNQENESEEQAPIESTSAPRSILKKRNAPVVSNEDDFNRNGDESLAFPQKGQLDSPTSPVLVSSPTNPSCEERGRTSQRIGSSASYERIQDASRGSSGMITGGSARARSNSNNSGVSVSPSSPNMDSSTSNSSSSGQFANTYGHKPSERRDSFRGRAGDGSKAMDGQSGSASSMKVPGSSSGAIDSDSDGRGSFDFNSPGYPASPLLGDKNEQSDGNDNSDARLYGRRKDASKWADSSRGKGKRSSQASSRRDVDDEDQPTRLSVDLDNLPPNTSPGSSAAPGGPTPLNTPTLALARTRVSRASKSSTSSSASEGSKSDKSKGPDSPTVPRRSSATGALVAPSGADKDAGVRVPLAHDYVEEDEGGIVGRAVEIVNTARDLIGALLGTGGDRGRSWRESY